MDTFHKQQINLFNSLNIIIKQKKNKLDIGIYSIRHLNNFFELSIQIDYFFTIKISILFYFLN
jgi:hypothetical protein